MSCPLARGRGWALFAAAVLLLGGCGDRERVGPPTSKPANPVPVNPASVTPKDALAGSGAVAISRGPRG